jgi:hypothetical protein
MLGKIYLATTFKPFGTKSRGCTANKLGTLDIATGRSEAACKALNIAYWKCFTLLFEQPLAFSYRLSAGTAR